MTGYRPNIMYVLDTETTGLNGYPYDFIVEIAICRVNFEEKTVESVYHEVVGYDIEKWPARKLTSWIFNNSSLTLEMVDDAFKKGMTEERMAQEIQGILDGQYVTSFNFDYDFDKFLFHQPYNLRPIVKQTHCIMRKAAYVTKIPNRYNYGEDYKWPTLDEIWGHMADDELTKGEIWGDRHRALFDTVQSSYILLYLNKNDKFFWKNYDYKENRRTPRIKNRKKSS